MSYKTLWLTGLSGSGKTTIAKKLIEKYTHFRLLDSNEIRRSLNKDLSLSPSDRTENIRRIAEVAKLIHSDVIVATISPLQHHRDLARRIIGNGFYEIYVSAPYLICEQRDTKGLYARAKLDVNLELIGMHQRYQIPNEPDLIVDTSTSVDECVDSIIKNIILEKNTSLVYDY